LNAAGAGGASFIRNLRTRPAVLRYLCGRQAQRKAGSAGRWPSWVAMKQRPRVGTCGLCFVPCISCWTAKASPCRACARDLSPRIQWRADLGSPHGLGCCRRVCDCRVRRARRLAGDAPAKRFRTAVTSVKPARRERKTPVLGGSWGRPGPPSYLALEGDQILPAW